MVIDIHSHIRKEPESKQEEKLLLDMQRNHIDFRIVSALEGWTIEEGNQYISDFVSRYPNCLGGCAVIDPKQADCQATARKALELPGMMMLEFNSVEHGYYPDVCSGVETVLEVAEEKKVPIKVFTGIGSRSMPHQWLKHVKQHPNLNFIFLHMGCFDYGYSCVDLAKETSNIYLETSNQYEVQILKKAVTKLPKEKLLFGSSYPERLTKCSLDIFDMFQLDTLYQEYLFGKNAARMLKKVK